LLSLAEKVPLSAVQAHFFLTVRTRSKNLVLAAMIVAVAMTFIDQTIVSIAAPSIQAHLGLSATGTQWAINAYLLTLAAFFAFGGRLADIAGHRRMVVIGVVVFAAASALCGATPTGSLDEPWIIFFRAVQGVGGAIMFPAALAIVVQTFPMQERGRALAAFFGIAGGLTAIGPILGGYLVEWTWRAIFWINLPVAAVGLVLIFLSAPETDHRPARIDYRGLVLIVLGVGLSVLGFQQSSIWGWDSPATWASIVVGLALLVVFVRVEQRTESPLIQISIFRIKPFFVENLVLGIAMLCFIPVFLFASEYAQISLGKNAQQSGLLLLYFFLGFAAAAQVGGRLLDRRGAKLPVTAGCVIAAVGFYLWGHRVTELDFGSQIWCIVLSGAGLGMMLGPASTDAVNRASRWAYGEATGITQTIRNYAGSLGLAILGTIQLSQMKAHVTDSLVARGESHSAAAAQADSMAQSSSRSASAIPHFIRVDFAHATQTVLYVMAAIMLAAGIAARIGLERGVQIEAPPEAAPGPAAA
jgi:EmrB/QacA subfamily drug resistance transporter